MERQFEPRTPNPLRVCPFLLIGYECLMNGIELGKLLQLWDSNVHKSGLQRTKNVADRKP